MAYDIFISYRRTDSRGEATGTNIARSIKQQLEISGYKDRVFFDYSEITDGEFEKSILPAIEHCKVFLLILSRESMLRCVNGDDWVRREISHAISHNVKIIPVNPDNKFDGYPDGFPEELDIIRRIQHQCIHTDASFESDVRNMIDKRIASVAVPVEYGRTLRRKPKTAGGGRMSRQILLVAAGLVLVGGVVWKLTSADAGTDIVAEPVFEIPAVPTAEENYSSAMEKMEAEAYEDAAALLALAAEEGHAMAQYNLGLCYENGQGVGQSFTDAFKWYSKAAGQGVAEAQSCLGFLYSEGKGVEKNEDEAFNWYFKAAEQGHAASQFNIGIFYTNGYGSVRQNHEEAVKWYTKVAHQGHDAAQYLLGLCYERGQGVERDITEAVSWFRKSAAQGNRNALKHLELYK